MTIASCALRAALLAALATGPAGLAFAEPIPVVVADDGAAASSDDAADDAALRKFLSSVTLQTGNVTVPGAHATLKLKPGYAFVPASDARRVLEDLWGNPPDKDVLGLIVPGTTSDVLTQESAWAVIVTYSDDGHVRDDEAKNIDYDDLLKDMKEGTHDANEERVKEGYPAVELVGWATAPHYDADSHKLYWARELEFKDKDGEQSRSLNYDIRVLGRHGYLQLSAIAPIGQLPKVEKDMPEVLAMTDFEAGKQYGDFDEKTDKIAAYGIGALVAGGIAAKAGLFAKLGLLLLAAKKFIVIGIAAIGGVIAKFFKKKKD
ncbi:putative membrane-anchored protein [Luteibacter rhizovicinus]|uniref:Putative membrane-anchored protein n=1 Tax=Luteibacter rhizovicinus TaxID=242606 RepID=A0A4R3YS82_9GAMM|nr:DUF2167 domain-containing protein [Luteibacter rhizovicinus]TCV93913.1 putative membrane-anchored protein [Luteibacter rhizovicinus]